MHLVTGSTNKTLLTLVAAYALALASAAPSSADVAPLFGWTRQADANGNIDIVTIDVTTGKAALDFRIQLPAGYDQTRDLTFDPRIGRFYGNVVGPAGEALAEIDPMARALTRISPRSGASRSPSIARFR